MPRIKLTLKEILIRNTFQMGKKNILSYTFSIILCCCLLSACNKLDDLDNLDVVNYDAEFAVPLFQGSASFDDVLKKFDEGTFITILPDGLIQLNYKGNVVATSSADIFGNLPPWPFPVVDTLVGLEFNETSNLDIDLVILKSGFLDWGYQIEHGEPLTVTVSIPNATRDGEVFERTRNFSSGVELHVEPAIDISGYTIVPTNDSIFVRYQAYRPNVGYADTLTNFFVRFTDFEASYVEGYLGTDLYELPRDTIEIEFFENWTRGDVYFEEPTILISVENSFGFPVRSKTNIMDILTVDGEVLSLESEFIDNGINFDYPKLDEIGEVKTTNFYFDKNNSNIEDIIGSNPVSVDYDLDAIPNPDENTAIRGFLTDSSYFRVQVEVEMPIHGTAAGFEARDTFDIDFGEEERVDHVEFKLIADNGIPVDVGLQAYFADASGTILDSLFLSDQALILEAAEVNSDGEVTNRVEKTTINTFESDRYANIKTAKKVFLNASFSTVNDGTESVRIYSDQDVKFRMGMKIGIKE